MAFACNNVFFLALEDEIGRYCLKFSEGVSEYPSSSSPRREAYFERGLSLAMSPMVLEEDVVDRQRALHDVESCLNFTFAHKSPTETRIAKEKRVGHLGSVFLLPSHEICCLMPGRWTAASSQFLQHLCLYVCTFFRCPSLQHFAC